ncbi:RNA-protein complex protein Nop10 [Pyrobaculum aerophilum]|uniref:RNA-protein complex protein Nop10 n=1 Tax=Pyrobaculum aerophilum TaxID=13773 RepID=UPI0023F23A0C|nr:RNA-protein complex protein Nop10 [Pyrobaculum aerophilum]MCX8137410.1 RNA-protein complex protein Nop10 [Pyrobaculum aerophilum]
MKSLLRRCVNCGEYTLSRDKCPRCGGAVRVPHPPKFSPEDKYQKYRILQKLLMGKLPIRDETKERLLRDLTS